MARISPISIEPEYFPRPPLVVMVSAGVLGIYFAICIIANMHASWGMQYAWGRRLGVEGIDFYWVHELGQTSNASRQIAVESQSSNGRTTLIFSNERKVEFDRLGLSIERDHVLRVASWEHTYPQETLEGTANAKVYTRIRLCRVDGGLILILLGGLPLFYFVQTLASGAAAILRIRKGRCWRCGYDVRRTTYVCPECGAAIKRYTY